jgi:sec-independent protein translocase protein TatC
MFGRVRPQGEGTFLEHLEELRVRIGRSLAYVVVGMIAASAFRHQLLEVLRHPADVAAARAGVGPLEFLILEPAGGFVLLVIICFVTGVIASAPFWLLEGWRFIEPALEPPERRYAVIVVPGATLLFLAGVAFCYALAPTAFEWFFRINMSMGVKVQLSLVPYLDFLLKFLLAVGLSFELPLVLVFFGYTGLLTSQALVRWWRHAVVAIFIIAAVATPTVDPFTMTAMALPLVGLYGLSIFLVKLVERGRRRERGQVPPEPPSGPPPGPPALPEVPLPTDPDSRWEEFYNS